MTALPAATAAPQLRLFGSPALLQGEKAVPLEADRAHGLLALLACRRDWVRRDELADLLYPGRDLESARSNLRKVVFLARKVEGVGDIEQRGDLLRWTPDTDLARFEAACDERRYGDAVAQYGGTLLLGLDAAWPPAARDWLDAERQRLQSRWHEACLRRLDELDDEPEAMRALAEAMLRQDPLDDVALQALARAQKALGRADAALAAVADYARRLTTELKIEPSAAVRQLASELDHPSAALPPPPAAPLVGRRHERTLVRERLADPACRLLTLLGPPGVGKSALARSIASDHGAAWVSLEPVRRVDEVPAALAAALNLVPDGLLAPWQGLAQVLGATSALIVLDNVETLQLAEPLGVLLAACPGLRLVATSRAPVGVAGEWRLPLDGLPLPDSDERDPDVLRANDAVALFERRVRPLVPGFDLGAEAADVVQLVHDVEGLPLAIELLAAWRRVMPVRAIVEELAASLDILEPSAPGERSVRAAFDRSWQQLGAAEQRALARLALLPAPCEREAVRRVVQAPLPVLAALVDRSLLRVDEAGRYLMHPLIRRCAQPLADDVEGLRERHARHTAETLSRAGAPLAELNAHAITAWDWGVVNADAAVLGKLAVPLLSHLQRGSRWHEGLHLGVAAAQALRPLLAAPASTSATSTERHERARALGDVILMLALFHYSAGELDASLEAVREARRIAAEHDLPDLERRACIRDGAVYWQRGDYEAAEAAFRSSIAAARAEGLADEDAERPVLPWLGLVLKSRGRYDEALSAYKAALDTLRAEGKLAERLAVPNNMGNLLRLLGRYDEALALLSEALALARETGALGEEPFLMVNIGLVHESAGALDDAAALAERARDSGVLHGEPMIEAAARLLWARVTARRKGSRDGLPEVHASLEIARRLKSGPLRVQCLSTAGVVLAATGDIELGVALVRWAMAHPDFARSEREDAARHLAALRLSDEPGAVLPSGQSADDLVARIPLV